MDSKGNTYICEREGNGVRKVDANGIMSTFAGTGERGTAATAAQPGCHLGCAKAIRCDIRTTSSSWIRRTMQSAASMP